MIPKGTFTSIGSWPFTDTERIVETILDEFDELPAWPQLVKRSFTENMYVQFSEGLPCIRIDEANEKIHFDTSADVFGAIQTVYENFLGGNLDYFAIGERYAEGLHVFARRAAERGRLPRVKGQLLGPISLGLTLTDENKKLILYNEQMADAILKVCAGKAAWQAEFLKDIADEVVVFIDEPYLVSFGSAYVNITRERIVAALDEIIDRLHEAGAVAGIHCCGNTDWSLLMDTKVDIVNFDAYDYAEGLSLYPRRIDEFLRGTGKYFAWGIVPTSEAKIASETGQSLVAALDRDRTILVEHGVDEALLAERLLVTPACGTGSISEDAATRVIGLLRETSRLVRER
jgi:hypothetical protein